MKLCAGVVMMIAAGLVGCGGSSSKHDGGDGPSGDVPSGDVPTGDVPTGGATRGAQCMQLMQVFCNRAGSAACMLFPADQVADCVSAGVTACCNGDCTASAVSTQAEINTCVADLNAASCASLDVANGGMLPASCSGVVRLELTATRSSALTGAPSSLAERAGRIISN